MPQLTLLREFVLYVRFWDDKYMSSMNIEKTRHNESEYESIVNEKKEYKQ